jgi:hypothetical protein
MLIDDYFNYCKKYKGIYSKCAILMQVGSFFEFYGTSSNKEGENVQEICSILEIQMTRKKKKRTNNFKK